MLVRTGAVAHSARRAALVAALVAAAAAASFGALAAPGTEARQGIGNHTFAGRWSFGAEGVIQENGESRRTFWEAGTFVADGKGNMTGGVEYSNLLGDDDALVDQPFTFSGTYQVNPDATVRANVDVTLPNGAVISKTVWFVLHDIRSGEAHGFQGGHLHAELGEHTHGEAGLHVGHRVE